MTWLWSNFDLVWGLTLTHIGLSVVPIVVGFVLSIPIGWLANRYRLSRGALLTICGILYAIPSFPLFVFMPVILGTKILDPTNLIVALSIYALAVMVRTSADAMASVPADVMQSATALGYSTWQRFWAVELPLAGPVLLAGIRVVSVSTVSLVSVGALVGVSSLGNLFTDGLQRGFITEVVIGIVGIMLIALFFDAILLVAGRFVMPWTTADRRLRRAQQRETVRAVTQS